MRAEIFTFLDFFDFFRDFANVRNLRFVDEQRHEDVQELFDYAYQTRNPILLHFFEKFAGVVGYQLEGPELVRYKSLKEEFFYNEGKKHKKSPRNPKFLKFLVFNFFGIFD